MSNLGNALALEIGSGIEVNLFLLNRTCSEFLVGSGDIFSGNRAGKMEFRDNFFWHG